MISLDKDFLQIWQELNLNEIRYIVCGSIASYLYGYHHVEDVIEIYIDNTPENHEKFSHFLADEGVLDLGSYRTPGIHESIQVVLKNGIVLHFLLQLIGVAGSFNECLGDSPTAEIEGVTFPFLHINHLIDNKKAVNRPKDQIDVIELEKIKEINEKQRQQSR